MQASCLFGIGLISFFSGLGSFVLSYFLVFEFCNTGGDQLIVPRKQFLDVVSVNAVLIKFGKNFCKICSYGSIRAKRFQIYGLGIVLNANCFQHFSQGHITFVSVDRDVAERHNFIVGLGGCALAIGERLNYKHVFALIHETKQAGASGYG